MTHSFPNRSSTSPFRKSVNNTIDERSSTATTKNKKRQSLNIVTSPDHDEEKEQQPTYVSSPSRVRQRLSSLFRTSSPVVMTIKETFNNKRASLSTVSFTAQQQIIIEPMDDSQSTTTTLSSGSSDHMLASPADARTIFSSIPEQHNTTTVWQPSVTILSYDEEEQEQEQQGQPTTPKELQFAITRSSSSLAFQVHQILGSTLEEVDEEIDQDWENSRYVLHQSLVSTGGGDSRNQHFWF